MPKERRKKTSFYRRLHQDSIHFCTLIKDRERESSPSNLNPTNNVFSEILPSHYYVMQFEQPQTSTPSLDSLQNAELSDSYQSSLESDVENRNIELDDLFNSTNLGTNQNVLTFEAHKVTKDKNLNTELQIWAVENNISHVALNGLLSILKPHLPSLPLDSRTLLKGSSHHVITLQMDPGQFYYFGLENKVKLLLGHDSRNLDICEVSVNVDGLPISHSSSSQLYPISVSLFASNIVSVVGLYHGHDKPKKKIPKSANDLMTAFVNEARDLCNSGIAVNNKIVPFVVRACICDAPAKSFIRYTKGHTGFFSCSKCKIKGEYSSRTYFPGTCFVERTDQDFILQTQEQHHTGTSVLVNIPNFGMVTSFPLDPMHLIYLGVVRKLLDLWSGKPATFKLSSRQLNQISENLVAQIGNIPTEFCRKPRAIKELKRWKATEYRMFLLYLGPVALKSVLEKKYYLNFMALHVSVSILSCPYINSNQIEYAHSLLIYFVQTFSVLYGEELISHNIHNLLHLCNDVKKFGNLNRFTAFPFENSLQSLKKMIRKAEKPLQQIVNRLNEMEAAGVNVLSQQSKHCNKVHNLGPLPENCFDPQYCTFNFKDFILKVSHPDNCCGLNDGSVVIIENFASSKDGSPVVIGRRFKDLRNFYCEPCMSSLLGIFVVSNLDNIFSTYPVTEIARKYVKLIINPVGYFVVVPILHTQTD